MRKNPINISKDAIFICGNFSKAQNKAQDLFNEVEELLANQGLEVINGAAIASQHENISLRQKETLKQRMAYMAMCDTVLLLDDWEKDESAKVLITAGHLLGKSMEYYRLSKYVRRGGGNF